MMLLVAVIGFVALSGTKATSYFYGTQNKANDYAQVDENSRYGQFYNGNSDLSHYNDQDSYHRNKNQKSPYDYNNYQYNQGPHDEYSEYNWDVQSYRYPENSYNQYKSYKHNSKDFSDDYNQFERSQFGGYDYQQYGESSQKSSYYPKYQNYDSFFDYNFGTGPSLGFNFQEYIKNDYTDNDATYDIGRRVAHKIIRLFNIIEKYAAHNGTIQTNLARDPLTLRQLVLPTDRHQFFNTNDNKVYGLTQGMFKAMYISTETNSVDLEYYFSSLLTKGYFKNSLGSKGSFDLKLFNTFVNVSTELENYNRNYAHSRNGNTEVYYENAPNDHFMDENVEYQYVQFVNRAIESEMIDNSYNGLVGNLRSEIDSSFEMPMDNKPFVIENNKSKLIVSFLNNQLFKSDKIYKSKKVQFFAFRQNKFGTGYKLKVKIMLSKEPKWESTVVAQKAHQQININNVNFEARNIYATAIIERVKRPNGEFKFNVEDASVKFEGFKFDIGKFSYDKVSHDNLASEVGQNLQNILEYGLSAAFQQQLYRLQQICQQSSYECTKYNL